VSSSGAEVSPDMAATTIGKTAISAAMKILGDGPKPSQSTISGAMAILGTALAATSNGSTARSTIRDAVNSMAVISPVDTASA
jgi:hypothetical protein